MLNLKSYTQLVYKESTYINVNSKVKISKVNNIV